VEKERRRMKKWGIVGVLLASLLLGGEEKITLILTAETTKKGAEEAEKNVIHFLEKHSGSGKERMSVHGTAEHAGGLWLAKVGPLKREVVESGPVRRYLMRRYPDLLILPHRQKEKPQRKTENGSLPFRESKRWQWMVLLLLGTIGAIALIHRFGQVSRIGRRQKDLEKFQMELEREIFKGEQHG